MSTEHESLYWLWLSLRCGAACRRFPDLIGLFESPFEIYRADAETLEQVKGLDDRLRNALCDKDLEEAYRILDFCTKQGIRLLTYGNPAYPSRLRNLQDPPVLLYCRGMLPDLDHRLCIAVVGTRRMSEYGRRMADKISYELAGTGTVVVSGMALGIDSAAACGALESGGTTVAVVGCGVDMVYPKEHRKLNELIAANGAVLSEYPPGTPPYAHNFPIRNRIISGLCQGTFLVEGDQKSGAMITAKYALLQGRELFVLPANVDERNAVGTNSLLQAGAIPVLRAENILNEYKALYPDSVHADRLRQISRRSDFREEAMRRMEIAARVYEPEAEEAPETKPSENAALYRPGHTDWFHKKKDKAVGSKGTEAKPMPKAAPAPAEPLRGNRIAESHRAAPAPDSSAQVLAVLTEAQQKVFAMIPLDHAVSLEALAECGLPVKDILQALTILEIKGLIYSLPAGLVARK